MSSIFQDNRGGARVGAGRPTRSNAARNLQSQFQEEMSMFDQALLDALADFHPLEMEKFIHETYGPDSIEGQMLHLCGLRTRAARSPADYAEIVSNGNFERPRHIELLNDVFVRSCYEPMRVIISLSVRSGKSYFTSRYAPAWFLQKFPDRSVLQLSHSRSLSIEFSSTVRDLIEHSAESLFGLAMDTSKRSKESFGLAGHNGSLYSLGVNGSAIGRGGHLLVVDDLYKDVHQAYSPSYNAYLKDWWRGTMRSRVEPGGSVFVVLARWTETDFAGWLIENAKSELNSDPWVEIKLPMIAESDDDPLGRKVGEPLWPERYDLAEIARIRASVGPITWASQYQQNPQSVNDSRFPLRAWQYIDEDQIGNIEAIVRFWDLSAGGSQSDYVAGVLMGINKDGKIIILDVAREKFVGEDSDLQVHEFVKSTISVDRYRYPKCKFFFEETPGAGKEVANYYMRNVFKGYDAESVRRHSSQGDKFANAFPLASAQQNEELHIPIKKVRDMSQGSNNEVVFDTYSPEWAQAFIEELYVFPDSRVNDDQVDAAAGAYKQLMHIVEKGMHHPLRVTSPKVVDDMQDKTAKTIATGAKMADLMERSILAKTIGKAPQQSKSSMAKIYRPSEFDKGR